MVGEVHFERLCELTTDGGFNQHRHNFFVPVNAANQEGRLAVLILDIHVDSAADQEFDYMLFVIFAG